MYIFLKEINIDTSVNFYAPVVKYTYKLPTIYSKKITIFYLRRNRIVKRFNKTLGEILSKYYII